MICFLSRKNNAESLKWQDAIKDVWEVRNPYEEALFSERDAVDSEALRLYDQDPEKALAYLTGYTKEKMEAVLQMYNGLHDELIVKYSNSR